jgi:hypothetical protein
LLVVMAIAGVALILPLRLPWDHRVGWMTSSQGGTAFGDPRVGPGGIAWSSGRLSWVSGDGTALLLGGDGRFRAVTIAAAEITPEDALQLRRWATNRSLLLLGHHLDGTTTFHAEDGATVRVRPMGADTAAGVGRPDGPTRPAA